LQRKALQCMDAWLEPPFRIKSADKKLETAYACSRWAIASI